MHLDLVAFGKFPVICAVVLKVQKDRTYKLGPGLPSLQMGVFEERPSHTPGMHWVSPGIH